MWIKTVIATMALSVFAASAQAGSFTVAGDGTYQSKTTTLMDRRFHNIMRQKYDFSCGSAALASLLSYHYNRPVEEKTVIDAMYAQGDQEKIRKEGFSLLDMKNYLQTIGLRANGYQESLETLTKVGIPAIVLINRKGYMHFVIVQGVTNEHVLLGDPALGRKVVSREEFNKMWENHILFVVDDEIKQARATFNTPYAWNMRNTRGFDMPIPNTNLAAVTYFTNHSANTFN